MGLGVAALVSWLVTAALGTLLLLTWLARNAAGRSARLGHRLPPPYFARPQVFGHVVLAVGGLVVWAAYLVADVQALAWAALATLLVVDGFGASMFGRWLGSRRMRVSAGSGRGEEVPAEARLPIAAVLSHGLLASATVLLVLLTALHVGPD